MTTLTLTDVGQGDLEATKAFYEKMGAKVAVREQSDGKYTLTITRRGRLVQKPPDS